VLVKDLTFTVNILSPRYDAGPP